MTFYNAGDKTFETDLRCSWSNAIFFSRAILSTSISHHFFPSVLTSHSASSSRMSEVSKIVLAFFYDFRRAMAVDENILFFSEQSMVIKLPVTWTWRILISSSLTSTVIATVGTGLSSTTMVRPRPIFPVFNEWSSSPINLNLSSSIFFIVSVKGRIFNRRALITIWSILT